MNKFFALLLLVSAPAFAVDLTYLPASKLTTAQQTLVTNNLARQYVAGVVVSAMNPSAFDSTSFNVTVEGASYTFTGSKSVTADQPNVDLWKGTSGSVRALLVRDSANGYVFGRLSVPGGPDYEIVQIGTGVAMTIKFTPHGVIDVEHP